jgi:hypothetical protein
VPRRGSFNLSVPVVRNAVGLLDDVLDALADPVQWCKGAFAVDAGGEPIEGDDVVAAVERPEVAARCPWGHALHAARRRGWRIEINTDRGSLELTRAPDSFLLAALVLVYGAHELLARNEFWVEPRPLKDRRTRMELRRLVFASVVANDGPETTHEDTVAMVVRAIEWLRRLLDQHNQRRGS